MSRSIEELEQEEASFQKYLRADDYTYIGPSCRSEFFPMFFNRADYLAPEEHALRRKTGREVMSDKFAVKKALSILPEDVEIKVHVITDDDLENCEDISTYCQKYNIQYPG